MLCPAQCSVLQHARVRCQLMRSYPGTAPPETGYHLRLPSPARPRVPAALPHEPAAAPPLLCPGMRQALAMRTSAMALPDTSRKRTCNWASSRQFSLLSQNKRIQCRAEGAFAAALSCRCQKQCQQGQFQARSALTARAPPAAAARLVGSFWPRPPQCLGSSCLYVGSEEGGGYDGVQTPILGEG